MTKFCIYCVSYILFNILLDEFMSHKNAIAQQNLSHHRKSFWGDETTANASKQLNACDSTKLLKQSSRFRSIELFRAHWSLYQWTFLMINQFCSGCSTNGSAEKKCSPKRISSFSYINLRLAYRLNSSIKWTFIVNSLQFDASLMSIWIE